MVDSRLLHGASLRQVVVLDRAVSTEPELVGRLQVLLDARITRVTPVKVDLVNDTTTVEVHYTSVTPASRESENHGAADQRSHHPALTR